MAAFIQSAKLMALLNRADPEKLMLVRVFSETKLALGADPANPAALIDFVREDIVPYKDVNARGFEHMAEPADARESRRSGEYWYDLRGKRTECHSLKMLLAYSLLSIQKAVPGTLEKLTKVKPRSRRIVARDPKDLFDKPHLAKDFAEKLGKDGWYYGTNNSMQETASWLKRACDQAGLTWGTDFKTSIMTTIDDLLVDN